MLERKRCFHRDAEICQHWFVLPVFNWSNIRVVKSCTGSATSSNISQVDVGEGREMKPSSAGLGLAPVHSEMYSPARRHAMASEMKNKLRVAGLRPTRTRVALAHMLFAQGNRHVSAEMLFEEANRAKVSVALATVYNTLHEFTNWFLTTGRDRFLEVIF
jgi:hypothetical protein